MRHQPLFRRRDAADSLPRNNANAFTLVELLVVVSIIALLIGILLPALNAAVSVANAIKCQSNMREFGRATLIYAEEHDGWWFAGDRIPDELHPDYPGTDNTHAWEGYHYFERLEDMGYIQEGPQVVGKGGSHNELFRCPTREIHSLNNTGKIANGGYGMIAGLDTGGRNSLRVLADDMRVPWKGDKDLIGGSAYDPLIIRLTYAPRPSEFPLYGDSINGIGTNTIRGTVYINGYNGIKHPNESLRGVFHTRHPGDVTNVWFLDGHVTSQNFEQISELGESGFHYAGSSDYRWIETLDPSTW